MRRKNIPMFLILPCYSIPGKALTLCQVGDKNETEKEEVQSGSRYLMICTAAAGLGLVTLHRANNANSSAALTSAAPTRSSTTTITYFYTCPSIPTLEQ